MTKLHVREWGTGERVAVLIHGLSGSSQTWWRIGPALSGLGYRVLAPDLTGHGQSSRDRYSRERWAGDLLEEVPAAPELAIGHSLGGVLLAMIVDRLQPARAIYEDPAWYPTEGGYGVGMPAIRAFADLTSDQLAASLPHWPAEEQHIRFAELTDWDPNTTRMDYLETAYVPVSPTVPSLVLRADPSALVGDELAARLAAAGFSLRTVPGTGHFIHNDSPTAYLEALDGWV
jgi:pimeloyl-ACP methyl ester carboxylesterase